MILLLDAGNTHIKWGILNNDGTLQNVGRTAYDELATLQEMFTTFPSQEIYGVAVCGAEKQSKIEQCAPSPINWLHSQKVHQNIINHYTRPEEHGADRWFNVLGARAFCPADALLIVSFGTATTIDILTADNHYLGGCILPGINLMHQSLVDKTAQLDFPLGLYQDFAINTPDALYTGAIDATCGAIDRQKQKLEKYTDNPHPVSVILTGGGAREVKPHLDKNVRAIDNLVLYGLAYWIKQ